jgi:CubicO group peptidase (beta-lactamase class C family)
VSFASSVLLILAIAGGLDTVCMGQPQPTTKPAPPAVAAFLRKEMRERQIPGLQVAIVQHGRLVLSGAYGLADVEHSVPVTTKTVFSIASITKAFTGVAAVQLVEQGKLNLDVPVSQYLDGLPVAWRPVTIRQLLTHVSGIPDIVDPKTGTIVANVSPESFISTANTRPMEFVPGERFSYNQTNYLLLSKVIERVSGRSYVDFITQGQLDIAGMRDTSFGGFSDIIHDRAQPYELQETTTQHVPASTANQKQLANIFYPSMPSLLAANGINTSAEQLAKWIISLQQGRLFKSQNSLKALWQPGVLKDGSHAGFGGPLNGYALGWPTVARPTHRALAPIGGNWAALFVYPDDDLTVIVLTNLQGAHPERFIDEVASFYVPDIGNAAGFIVPRAIRNLEAELTRRGFSHALEFVDDPKQAALKAQLREADINSLGYRLMGRGQQKQALEIFKLNVHLFPDSANTYDSLADAYDGLGDRELAIQNYRQSLKLNPQNRNAAEHLAAPTTKAP